MRSHGKLAVLKDDEIDRLERANAVCAEMDRAEVMESMYNRLDPKPKGATAAAKAMAPVHAACFIHVLPLPVSCYRPC